MEDHFDYELRSALGHRREGPRGRMGSFWLDSASTTSPDATDDGLAAIVHVNMADGHGLVTPLF